MNQSHVGLSLPSHPPTRTYSLTFLPHPLCDGMPGKMTHPLKVMDVWRHQQNPWIVPHQHPCWAFRQTVRARVLPYLGLTILTVGGAATPSPARTHLSLSVLTDSSVKERKSMQ